MKRMLIGLMITFVMAGCTQNPASMQNYTFRINGLDITMGEATNDFLVKTGNPINQYSAPSCAFDGDDTVYDFGSYQITTYVNKGKEIFTGVYLLDDSVSTQEGIKIGSSLSKMLETYGDDYQENYGAYTYSLGLTDLSFVVINDVITSISYLHKVD
ncbi:MAG: hypothetical protein CVU94_01920 [Firmicutes bacterium HGW-Firmicutes-19]|jgi:hypothetical protein|nr:MAG: hypothetical protein CVU94_01920 [Firmicutes bacterium HGW-Firmicutes-19]